MSGNFHTNHNDNNRRQRSWRRSQRHDDVANAEDGDVTSEIWVAYEAAYQLKFLTYMHF